MESSFIDWLNSIFGNSVGTQLAILVGGSTLIGGIITGIKKVKGEYDKKIQQKLLKEEKEQEFRESMKTVASQVSDMQNELVSLSSTHKDSLNDINNKLEEMWNTINESKQESRDGDIALESQMKNYSNTLANLQLQISSMDDKTTLLIDSDKEGIKSYITGEYYKAVAEGHVKLHVLQCLELRYDKYLKENGNTYIKKLMDVMREMPNE